MVFERWVKKKKKKGSLHSSLLILVTILQVGNFSINFNCLRQFIKWFGKVWVSERWYDVFTIHKYTKLLDKRKTSSGIRTSFLHRYVMCVFLCYCGILPPPSQTSCVFSLIVMSGSFGSLWKGKQQGRGELDLWGMIGRDGNLGNWFLWVAHGRELCSRRVKSFGRFRGVKGQELDISESHWSWKRQSNEGILLDTPQRRPVRESNELLWDDSGVEARREEGWNLSTTSVISSP